tara:strand:- start:532 stop:1005 length:474 start_codon:yes stop_codon:yes gene_type:complete
MTSILKVDTIQGANGSDIPYIKGHVLQVKQNVIDGNSTSTASTSFVSSPVTGSITPSKSTSKILVRAVFSLYHVSAHSTYATLYRGTTDLVPSSPNGIVRVYSGNANIWHPSTIEWLDEPNTTSAVTYTVYFKVTGGTGYINVLEGQSTVTMMEIGG